MLSIVGGTLLFQGWRLDPLLLLCQAMTTSVAFWYGMETLRLRSKQESTEGSPTQSRDDVVGEVRSGPQVDLNTFKPPGARPGFLPPSMEQQYPWGAQQDGYMGGRWNAPSRGEQLQDSYAETIQYDYYGNPQGPYIDRMGQYPPQNEDPSPSGYGMPYPGMSQGTAGYPPYESPNVTPGYRPPAALPGLPPGYPLPSDPYAAGFPPLGDGYGGGYPPVAPGPPTPRPAVLPAAAAPQDMGAVLDLPAGPPTPAPSRGGAIPGDKAAWGKSEKVDDWE